MKVPVMFKVLQIKMGLLAWCTLALSADGDRQGFRDYAPVVRVEPIMETSYQPVTHHNCVDPLDFAPQARQVASTIGEDIRRQIHLSRAREACQTIIESELQQRIIGYWVTYRYRGHTSRTRLSYDPGPRIPVDVGLSPLP